MNIFFPFLTFKDNYKRKEQFARVIRTMLRYTTIPIHYHVVTDANSIDIVKSAINPELYPGKTIEVRRVCL